MDWTWTLDITVSLLRGGIVGVGTIGGRTGSRALAFGRRAVTVRREGPRHWVVQWGVLPGLRLADRI